MPSIQVQPNSMAQTLKNLKNHELATRMKSAKTPSTGGPTSLPKQVEGNYYDEAGPNYTPAPGIPVSTVKPTPLPIPTNGNTGVVPPAKQQPSQPIPSVPTTPVAPTQAPLPTYTAPQQQAMPTYTPPQQATPTYNAPKPFEFKYDYLNYDKAKGQAEQQFNPLFEQAVQGVKAQQYQNNLDSGQSSAVRGLAHSGLAQDALTKIAIASQGQISGLNAQKMSDVAKMAQQMMERDQDRGDRLRSQQYAEYSGDRDFGYGQYRDSVGDSRYNNEQAYNQYRDKVGDTRYNNETAYNQSRDNLSDQRYNNETTYNRGRDTANDAYRDKRDTISDNRYTDETTYNRGRDTKNDAFRDKQYDRGVFESDRGYNRDVFESDRGYNYQSGRDKINDSRYADETKYNRGQDALNRHDSNYWNKVQQNNVTREYNRNVLVSDREWKQMSPAEKMRMSMELANSMKLKKASGEGGGGGGSSYANPYIVNDKQQIDLSQFDMNELMNYYYATLDKGSPKVPYGTKAYYNKMKGLEY